MDNYFNCLTCPEFCSRNRWKLAVFSKYHKDGPQSELVRLFFDALSRAVAGHWHIRRPAD